MLDIWSDVDKFKEKKTFYLPNLENYCLSLNKPCNWPYPEEMHDQTEEKSHFLTTCLRFS